MMLAAFMFGTWVAPAYGQLPEPSVRADWIHPGPVPAGSDIPLYAMVHNQGEGDIPVLSFRTHYPQGVNYPYNEPPNLP